MANWTEGESLRWPQRAKVIVREFHMGDVAYVCRDPYKFYALKPSNAMDHPFNHPLAQTKPPLAQTKPPLAQTKPPLSLPRRSLQLEKAEQQTTSFHPFRR